MNIKYRVSNFYRWLKREFNTFNEKREVITVQIELSGKCSATCEFCDWTRRPEAQKIYMPTELALKAVRDARELNPIQISFHVSGESLLHPDLFKILPTDYQIVLSTNCLALEGDIADRLAGMENLYIILAVLWAESQYKREVSISNAIAFLDRNPLCRGIYVQMICSEHAIRFDKRMFRIFYPYLEKFPNLFLYYKQPYSQEPNHENIPFPEDYKNEVMGFFPHGIPKHPQINIDEMSTPQSCGIDCLAFPPSPTTDIIVQSDGQIKPCFYRWSKWGLGNIRDTTLKEAWESERMKEIRYHWHRGDPENVLACHDCIRIAKPRGDPVWWTIPGETPPALLNHEQAMRAKGPLTPSEKYRRELGCQE